MLSIQEIYNEMDMLLKEMDQPEAIEEVNLEFPPRKAEMQELLDTTDLESYLKKYDEICKSDIETLMCFDLDSADELKEYIEKENISFDDLKTETVRATYELLENIIYEAEEDEY